MIQRTRTCMGQNRHARAESVRARKTGGAAMLLCAQYILPITSEPFQDGAVLVRDGVIRDIGKVDMLKLRYPEAVSYTHLTLPTKA